MSSNPTLDVRVSDSDNRQVTGNDPFQVYLDFAYVPNGQQLGTPNHIDTARFYVQDGGGFVEITSQFATSTLGAGTTQFEFTPPQPTGQTSNGKIIGIMSYEMPNGNFNVVESTAFFTITHS